MQDLEKAASGDLEISGLPSGVSPLVVRSIVQPKRSYKDYEEDLRWDFFYSCAYCNTMEFEAQGFSFAIDHYLPQVSNAKLTTEYSNLMWCCSDCNSRKGDLELPKDAQAAGFRFYKADIDDYFTHFRSDGDKISGLTPIGMFTFEILFLNRQKLLRIRAMRRELGLAKSTIVDGINGLRRLPIDQLPLRSKGEASVKRRRALEASDSMQQRIDTLLREFAHSELVDKTEDDVEAQRGRRELLSALGAMYPGPQRGRAAKA